MANEVTPSKTEATGWKASQVYALAVVCLVIGLAVGYLFRGSRSPLPVAASVPAADQAGANPHAARAGQPPTLDQMKQMADKKAEPLLAKLKDDPKDFDTLVQLGKIYLATHQFKDAAGYYTRAVEVKPKDVPTRTTLASTLYYEGDIDGALQQLAQATTDDPKDANSLFNLGMIRWQGKKDSKGALAAWAQLLKTNPQLEPAKKAQVQRMMADVRQAGNANQSSATDANKE
jgi:cytochrome c-type biogenesis protein CcmH/NrfG